MAVFIRSLLKHASVAAQAGSLHVAVRTVSGAPSSAGRSPESGPSFLKVWASDSTPALVERKVKTVSELKQMFQKDIVVADACGKIIPIGLDLPASSEDEPVAVFPVAVRTTRLYGSF